MKRSTKEMEFIPLKKMTKREVKAKRPLVLQDIPQNSKIKLTIVRDGSGGMEEMCTFVHADGMYSLIYTSDGHAVHLGRMTEVKLVDDHYEIV